MVCDSGAVLIAEPESATTMMALGIGGVSGLLQKAAVPPQGDEPNATASCSARGTEHRGLMQTRHSLLSEPDNLARAAT